MQRFTLIHDGSNEGWQAAYLAFHVATRLGAPLLILLFDSTADKKVFTQRATEVEVGGRAAGVAIETRLVADFSVDVVSENAIAMNGLFTPRRLVPDGVTALRFLKALSCPMWIVSKESEVRKMAVLVSDPVTDEDLIHYAITLSHRLREPLTGIIKESKVASTAKVDATLSWIPLPDFSLSSITSTLTLIESGLLVMPAAGASLVDDLPFNCVVYPVAKHA